MVAPMVLEQYLKLHPDLWDMEEREGREGRREEERGREGQRLTNWAWL